MDITSSLDINLSFPANISTDSITSVTSKVKNDTPPDDKTIVQPVSINYPADEKDGIACYFYA